jgi:hypothetical protein
LSRYFSKKFEKYPQETEIACPEMLENFGSKTGIFELGFDFERSYIDKLPSLGLSKHIFGSLRVY